MYFIGYLVLINIFAFMVCIIDKSRAKRGVWRISENFLMGVSVLGGSIGMYFAMKFIRHKTKHKKFMVGLPLLIFLQIVFSMYIYKNFY